MITIEFARTLYPADADSAHDFDHVLRVVAMAVRIAQAEGARSRRWSGAALLHDIGLGEGRAGHERQQRSGPQRSCANTVTMRFSAVP